MAKTALPAAEGLLGRVIDRFGVPLDGRGPIADMVPSAPAAEAPLQAGAASPWPTGIKVVDFYAPIALGTTAALLAAPGVGLIVTVCELIHRLADRRGGCAVFTQLDAERNELSEMVGQLRESGVEGHTTLVAGPPNASPADRREVVETALAAAEGFAVGGRDVLLVVDDGLLSAETAGLLRGRARAVGGGSITTVLCFWRHTGPEPELAPEARAVVEAAEVRLVFSRELAQQAIWPAIDALASRSRLLVEGGVSAEQLRAAEAARALLRAGEGERARKLLLFQAQPFFVAEPFTARPAEYVPLEESVRAFAAIAAGAYDGRPDEELRFVGAAPAAG